MSTSRFIRFVAGLVFVFLMVPAFAASKADLEAALSHDGLKLMSVNGIELAYVRPNANLSGYTQFMLDPIYVAFSKNWDASRPGSNIKMGQGDREEIKATLAKLVKEEFIKELQTNASYKLAGAAGPDVLRVKVSVVNLYVNSPDTLSAGPRIFMVSAGEMTLFMELFDSESGQVLARVVDRRVARSAGDSLVISNRTENTAQAQEIISGWARILRNGLDKARAIGKK